MKFIIDPESFTKQSIFSYEGKSLLKKYIKHVQSGGSGLDSPEDSGEEIPPFASEDSGEEGFASEDSGEEGFASVDGGGDVIPSFFNQSTLALYQFSNFYLNIFIMGEHHARAGFIHPTTNKVLTPENVQAILMLFYDMETSMTRKINECCVSFYAELDIPPDVNILKKYKDEPDNPTSKSILSWYNKSTPYVLDNITNYMYELDRTKPNFKTISFDLRRSHLYVGVILFSIHFYDIKYNFDNIIKSIINGIFLALDPGSQNGPPSSKNNKKLVSDIRILINELSTKSSGESQNETLQYFNQNINEIFNTNKFFEYLTSQLNNQSVKNLATWTYVFEIFAKNIPFFRTVLIDYLIETVLRILKEYYKCKDIKLQQKINPLDIYDMLPKKYIWMTDMYAFYRFFMRQKETIGFCNDPTNHFLHCGDAHGLNLRHLIENIFTSEMGYFKIDTDIRNRSLNYTVHFKSTYTLHYVQNGNLLTPNHKAQINALWQTSYGHNRKYEFNEGGAVRFILIIKNIHYNLKNNGKYPFEYMKIVGCYVICNLDYAYKNNLILNEVTPWRELLPDKMEKTPKNLVKYTKPHAYIYNLAVDSDFRGGSLCNYMISNSLCYINKKILKNNNSRMFLIAENPCDETNTPSRFAANKCYEKYMDVIIPKSSEWKQCEVEYKTEGKVNKSYCNNKFCFYRSKPRHDKIWASQPSLPKQMFEPETKYIPKKFGFRILKEMQQLLKHACITNYKQINIEICEEVKNSNETEGGAGKPQSKPQPSASASKAKSQGPAAEANPQASNYLSSPSSADSEHIRKLIAKLKSQGPAAEANPQGPAAEANPQEIKELIAKLNAEYK
jgi:hypothetical protein